MDRLAEVVVDAFASLSHKAPIGEGSRAGSRTLAPTWVGEAHRKRLVAYTVRRAYAMNVARLALPSAGAIYSAEGMNEKAAWTIGHQAGVTNANRREYGDAALLINRVVDAVLGEEVALAVDGAADQPPDEPELPDEPKSRVQQALPLGAPPENSPRSALDQRIDKIRTARWEKAAQRALDEWEASFSTHELASDRQDWLREWADTEQFVAKLYESEADSVGLGDGVYVVSWLGSKRRPVVDVYDPMHYFPVLDPQSRAPFPTKVHIAWEFEDVVDGKPKLFVHRITYEMRELGEARHYPWQPKDEAPSTQACFMTEATWPLNDIVDGRGVEDFSDDRAVFAVNEDGMQIRDLDLGIDFVPVVHVPSVPSRKEHFGPSIIDSVAQILDDIAATDTDIASASRFAGTPFITVSGTTIPEKLAVGPGKALGLGANGRMDLLDTSRSLDALLKLAHDLLDRLSINSQVTAEVLGRVKASDVPSGVAFALAFGPMRGLIGKMRLVRNEKHPILLKFVQRLAQVGGVLPVGENPRAEVVFGSFLPSDQTAVLDAVVKLLEKHGISRLTGLQWLADAGFDMGDLNEELRRLTEEDFAGANDLKDVVGVDQAAEYLGRDAPPPAVAPISLNIPGGAVPPPNAPPTAPGGTQSDVVPPAQA